MSLEHTVIDNIRRLRKEKGISQEKLAEYCNTSTSYIGLMEGYRNVPKLSTIEKIAQALNVPPSVLFVEHNDVPSEDKISEIRAAKRKLHHRVKEEILKEMNKTLTRLLKEL